MKSLIASFFFHEGGRGAIDEVDVDFVDTFCILSIITSGSVNSFL
jgi:hypothetical protein